MRVRPWRPDDISTLFALHTLAAQADSSVPMSMQVFTSWLEDIAIHEPENGFIVTDDDDELMTWSQAGTLEGVEGETIGFTVVHMQQELRAYHFLCQGTVHPLYRRQGAGRILLVSARNRARLLASDFEFEAEQAGRPIYLEALLPGSGPASRAFAMRFDMQPVDEASRDGLYLYRTEL
jgi:GNAT superfamily N-acetyltransferase